MNDSFDFEEEKRITIIEEKKDSLELIEPKSSEIEEPINLSEDIKKEEKIEKIDDIEIKDVNLGEYEVTEIVSAISIEPVILTLKVKKEDKENTIGIPGFIERNNAKFYSLDGNILNMKEFDKNFYYALLKNII